MLLAVAVIGIALFSFTLWCSITVIRIHDIPAWRRFLPLFLFVISLGASALRAFDIPEVANAIAFPLNLAVIVLSLREIHARRRRSEAGNAG
ncbi:hypothetical protein AB0F96_05580 [Streptomyces sp. NPDC023998]|uniref:hypothetical protein n=1 Tax=Streptomyces sp. NPDC023998 TaxID=3154597 RepID=UPI0033EA1EEF